MIDQRWIILRRISIGLSLLGILIAGYLTWAHYANATVLCIGSNGCEIVQQSVYSTVAGTPVALFGLIGYVVIAGLLVVEENRALFSSAIPLLIFGLTLIGAAYSIYLTYLELFVIFAICQYCVTSAIIMVILFTIAIYRMMTAPSTAD